MSFIKIIIALVILFGSASFVGAIDLQVADSIAVKVVTKDLVDYSEVYEGRTVVLRGEVIGDIMRRGQFAWVNVHDKFNAVGVWVPAHLTEKIGYKGSYRYKGDIVEVQGIFKHADPQLGGDFCIRAEQLSIIEKGRYLAHPPSATKINISLSMLVGTLFLLFLRLLIKTKEKKESY